MSSIREIWSYECEWDGCSKSFKSTSTLEAHYRRHLDERPYACDYRGCGEAFHDLGALKRHQRTHPSERPFVCKYESCGQAFHLSKTLDQHYQTHTEQLSFTCKYDSCGQDFRDRGELTEHHHTHKQRPLACEYDSCSRTFAQRESLESHMHMHTREQPYLCSYEACNKSFYDRGELSQHEESHTKKRTLPRSEKSYNETFAKPLELFGPYREEHDMTTKPAEVVRPIRLRLSQPKRQNPGSLEDSPRKRIFLPLSMGKTLGELSTSDPKQAPEICSESKASAQGSAEQTLDKTCTNGEPSGHGTSVYTRVCGVHSIQTASPEEVKNRAGNFHCPRCNTNFTRACGVRKHFVGCITRYGNPDSLKWTDHPSLQKIVQFYARNGFGGRQYDLSFQVIDVKKFSCQFPKEIMLRLIPKPLCSIGQESMWNDKSTYKSTRPDALLQKNIVQPMCKRRDALRRSKYNPETIARDILLATGSHPSMDPLNAHLDILRKRFRNVKPESNMSTFRWDLVDPMQDSEQHCKKEPEIEPRREHEHEHESRQGEEEVEPGQSTPYFSEARKDAVQTQFNDNQWHYGSPFSLPSRTSMKIGVPNIEVPFTVTLPKEAHFGQMSTIFSNVFDRDPSARLMSSNEDLWAAIFTMLEHCHHGPNFVTRTVVRRYTGHVIGWIACHEVDTLRAMPGDPLAYLDWTTAAHLLPPQISRFTSTEESAKEKTERLNQRKVGQGLALTIQARATEAQAYLVPSRRLVINALVVHPSYQGRGVASALLKRITEMVDMDQRAIWIQAPEDPAVAQGLLKAGLFRRAGFTCAGELNLDLDCFASPKGEHDKGKVVQFGTYKWNYMVRWPHPVSKITTATVK